MFKNWFKSAKLRSAGEVSFLLADEGEHSDWGRTHTLSEITVSHRR